jgi:hypothetical protein
MVLSKADAEAVLPLVMAIAIEPSMLGTANAHLPPKLSPSAAELAQLVADAIDERRARLLRSRQRAQWMWWLTLRRASFTAALVKPSPQHPARVAPLTAPSLLTPGQSAAPRAAEEGVEKAANREGHMALHLKRPATPSVAVTVDSANLVLVSGARSGA